MNHLTKILLIVFCLLFSNIFLDAASNNEAIALAKKQILDSQPSAAINTLLASKETTDDITRVNYYLALAYSLDEQYTTAIDYAAMAYSQDHRMVDDIQKFMVEQDFKMQPKVGMVKKIQLARYIRNQFLNVVAEDPNNTGANVALAYFYLYAPFFLGGKEGRVIYHTEQAMLTDKQSAYAIYNNLYREKEDDAKRLANLQTWHQTFPNDWDAASELSRVQLSKGYPSVAYKILKQWLAKNPNDLEALYQVGRLAAISGEYLEEGKKNLEHYLTQPVGYLTPEHDSAHWRLALISQHQNNRIAAREHIAAGLKINPKNQQLKKLLQEVKMFKPSKKIK